MNETLEKLKDSSFVYNRIYSYTNYMDFLHTYISKKFKQFPTTRIIIREPLLKQHRNRYESFSAFKLLETLNKIYCLHLPVSSDPFIFSHDINNFKLSYTLNMNLIINLLKDLYLIRVPLNNIDSIIKKAKANNAYAEISELDMSNILLNDYSIAIADYAMSGIRTEQHLQFIVLSLCTVLSLFNGKYIPIILLRNCFNSNSVYTIVKERYICDPCFGKPRKGNLSSRVYDFEPDINVMKYSIFDPDVLLKNCCMHPKVMENNSLLNNLSDKELLVVTNTDYVAVPNIKRSGK